LKKKQIYNRQTFSLSLFNENVLVFGVLENKDGHTRSRVTLITDANTLLVGLSSATR